MPSPSSRSTSWSGSASFCVRAFVRMIRQQRAGCGAIESRRESLAPANASIAPSRCGPAPTARSIGAPLPSEGRKANAMSVVDIGGQKKESPMLKRIEDPQLRQRVLSAQAWAASKYNELGSWKKFAQLVGGYSEAAVSSYVSGSYNGSPVPILPAIER